MLPDSRTIAKATLLVLVAGVTPNALAAGGTPGPTPAPVIAPAPPGPLPTWAIAVPVQLASIPPMYPRFSVACSVWTPPIEHPFPLQSPNPRVIGPAHRSGRWTRTVPTRER
jgi:hypothetical protein